MKHLPEPKDLRATFYFDGRPSSQEVRIPCSCGWRGEWMPYYDEALVSIGEHLQAAKAEAVSA